MFSHTNEPVLSGDSLLYLLPSIPEDKRRLIHDKLASKNLDEVQKLHRQAIWGGKRQQAWMTAEELSRRGVPPSLRTSPFLDGKPRIPEEDIFLRDLQWLAARYPKHRAFMSRYQSLFRPTQFEKTAMFLLSRGLHQPALYIKALALNEDQQVECVYIRGTAIRARMDLMDSLSKPARDLLQLANRTNPRARAQGEHWRKTVDRRHAIWRCGSMANWQPQRTAELYHALTGERMTRSLAGKIIAEVHRDFPLSRPPTKRRRRRSQSKRSRPPMAQRSARTKRAKRKRAATAS